ncbi:MAG: hypothetical protein K2P99_06675 [Burkholderiales bacterium]|nr:hypothetical protein [Burkholderiales bacterium]
MDNQKNIDKITNEFVNNLVFQGATYASITIFKNGKLELYNSTNAFWDEFYHENNYAKDCHLVKTGNNLIKSNNKFTILWDLIIPDSEIANIINEYRIKNNLCHGISFVQKNPDGTMQGINLTGKYSDLSFTKAVIENKKQILEEFNKIKLSYDLQNFK